MTNILDSIIANQNIAPSVKKDTLPAFNITTEGKVKPQEYKGKLLPSRIFGSPIEYAKDLKKDVVSLGRAAKGQANDHELGRINDIAMKLGSLGLATYLFVKNPLKLSKAMEFAGFGAFFASMALWPKLAIQAPIKARTGVDIHQKYLDSQGRKKMVFQDPQYVLTDLYSKEDLEKMGDKLGVSKNLSDRDNFIKQRAQKTALQGNTLWMMTAGVATPVMSALACNRLEKPINSLLEKVDIQSTARAIKDVDKKGFFARIRDNRASKAFEKFLTQNSGETMSEGLISQITSKFFKGLNAGSVETALTEELKALKANVVIDESFVKAALKDKMPVLSEAQKTAFDKAVASGSLHNIAEILSQAASPAKRQQSNFAKNFLSELNKHKVALEQPKLGDVADKIRTLQSSMSTFASRKGVLDKFVSARVGDQSGTYIANQWGKVGDKLLKSLKLNSKELKAVANGDLSKLYSKMADLSANDAQFDKLIKDLMKLIGDYEGVTGSKFTSTVKTTSEKICGSTGKQMLEGGFERLAKAISNGAVVGFPEGLADDALKQFMEEAAKNTAKNGTVENLITTNARERIAGAQSSFYRMLQSIDLFRGIKQGTVKTTVEKALKANGQKADAASVEKIIEACKKVLFNATTTDYVEKLTTSGFNLSEAEYKTVMQVLFDDKAATTLEKSLGDKKEILAGLRTYKKEFMEKVANWQNGMTPELSRRTVDGVTSGANAVERNNLAGKPISNMIQDVAKKTYNSNKWLKIFGGTMLALTAATLIATLMIGRKGKTEKEAEAQQKANG